MVRRHLRLAAVLSIIAVSGVALFLAAPAPHDAYACAGGKPRDWCMPIPSPSPPPGLRQP